MFAIYQVGSKPIDCFIPLYDFAAQATCVEICIPTNHPHDYQEQVMFPWEDARSKSSLGFLAVLRGSIV
jgi:hypothetical protein